MKRCSLNQALASREEQIKAGKMTTIIFIRDFNSKGQEVSGYIDYAHRLRIEDFVPYFERRLENSPILNFRFQSWHIWCICYVLFRKKLLPKPTDLSYYNWETQLSTSNSSPHYQVIADGAQGLLFKNKRDRKIISVNPELPAGDNSVRIEIPTTEYAQIVLYDHTTRRRVWILFYRNVLLMFLTFSFNNSA